ncbi:TetR/AcrR family transcriptional regulator [Paractinoplanes lichenicola]|uniref:TetR/AcrR family transcriptional regulator n=1 Tax=Paractinoplanes lichenicola TaxID=2802976 RepID=A0ABS1VL63_9ACTN|nr:TetR/AcrR family transcriptional regulator [Actinoplanes lichenicola]MBL7255379.1 TetR/AcrR family transcriptional regulator [Actinoplanes lichenicola]
MPEPTSSPGTASTAERIVAAAMGLLAEGGSERLSTRAVCDAAGVQPPTIYRLFGSMNGLLDAVAREGFLIHQRGYRGLEQSDDPVDILRKGWDQHVAFGLANPYLYSIMYGRADPATPSFAAVAANEGLRYSIRRLAEAGLLRVDEEFAAFSVTAAGVGTTFTLLTVPEENRSLDESARMREMLIRSIVSDRPEAPDAGVVGTAAALNVLLDTSSELHPAERGLMHHWLDRLARSQDADRNGPPA